MTCFAGIKGSTVIAIEVRFKVNERFQIMNAVMDRKCVTGLSRQLTFRSYTLASIPSQRMNYSIPGLEKRCRIPIVTQRGTTVVSRERLQSRELCTVEVKWGVKYGVQVMVFGSARFHSATYFALHITLDA